MAWQQRGSNPKNKAPRYHKRAVEHKKALAEARRTRTEPQRRRQDPGLLSNDTRSASLSAVGKVAASREEIPQPLSPVGADDVGLTSVNEGGSVLPTVIPDCNSTGPRGNETPASPTDSAPLPHTPNVIDPPTISDDDPIIIDDDPSPATTSLISASSSSGRVA